MAARRAVVRWAWRMFRREWRQQALVLGLLTVAVAAAVGFATSAYNTVGVPENASFGTANHRYVVEHPDTRTLPADVAAAADRFGPVDVIGEWSAAVPGSVESLAYRAQDPDGPYSGPMLAELGGRYPAGAGEVALTDGVAGALGLRVGDVLDLDGRRRTVVGLVENPSDLGAEFALTAPDDLAGAATVTILVGGTGAFDEVRALRDFGDEHLPGAEVTTRSDAPNAQAAAAVVGVAEVVVVLVSLVASAGFVALAQRRLRQLGMLGAIGATERHLRLVVVANGATVGTTAALAGAAVGVAGWLVAAPRLEAAAGFRIERWHLPWWLVAATMAAVTVTASLAAWWPARTVARVPVTHALSGRPPEPRPARRAAAPAAVLLAAGVAALVAADGRNPLLVAVGTAATVAGVLVLSPLAIRALAAAAGRLPVAVRLALRDLSRYRSRSGAALAAVSLALGIPVAVVVSAAAAEAGAPLGNLPADEVLVWTRDRSQPEGVSPFYTEDPSDEGFAPYLPDLGADDLARMGRAVDEAAAAVGAGVTPLEVAVDPRVDDPNGRVAVTLARRTEIGYLDVALLYVAAPGTDPGAEIVTTAPPGPSELVVDHDHLWLANTSRPPAEVTEPARTSPSYTSLPGSFITREALAARGWDRATVGWRLRAADPFTAEQVARLREAAAGNGLLIETRHQSHGLVALRWGATAAGTLVALAVLAMTVGIIRAEAARDLRVLAATGATSTMRRTLTAATAGGLAALGALLGTAGTYLALTAGYVGDAADLLPLPLGPLAVIVLGVPLAAVAVGWAVSGREPAGLARQPLE